MRIVALNHGSLSLANVKLGMGGGLFGNICCFLHLGAVVLGLGGLSGFFGYVMLAYQPYLIGASAMITGHFLYRRHRAGEHVGAASVLGVALLFTTMYLLASTLTRLLMSMQGM